MAEPAVEIDLRSPVPPFEQIRARIADLVAAGELPAGTRLPSVRALAGDLGIAPNTVVRAYRELEASGVVSTRRGAGTRVAERPAADASLLEVAAQEYLDRVEALGAGPDRAIEVLEIVAKRR